MVKVVRAVLGLIAGYIAGAAGGYGLVTLVSSNTHDKSMEAVMTAAFVAGPVGALIGIIVALMWARR